MATPRWFKGVTGAREQVQRKLEFVVTKYMGWASFPKELVRFKKSLADCVRQEAIRHEYTADDCSVATNMRGTWWPNMLDGHLPTVEIMVLVAMIFGHRIVPHLEPLDASKGAPDLRAIARERLEYAAKRNAEKVYARSGSAGTISASTTSPDSSSVAPGTVANTRVG